MFSHKNNETALTLYNSIGIKNKNIDQKIITYGDLRNAEVGDVFRPDFDLLPWKQRKQVTIERWMEVIGKKNDCIILNEVIEYVKYGKVHVVEDIKTKKVSVRLN